MPRLSKSWSEIQASRILDQADRAPTDSGFGRKRGIKAQRLTWWRTRLDRPRRRGAPAAAPTPEFVKVVGDLRGDAVSVEILVGNGRQLRVSTSIDPDVLARLKMRGWTVLLTLPPTPRC